MCKKRGIHQQTYYKWRREYGYLRMGQYKRLKELEKENARPKKLLAESEPDKAILQEAASGDHRSIWQISTFVMVTVVC